MPDTFATLRHEQETDTRYVLCAPDGREIMDVEPEFVPDWELANTQTGNLIKRIVTRLDSIPQVWL